METMLDVIRERASSGEKPLVRQEVLAEFVDCASRITENLNLGARFKENPRFFVESQLPDTYFSDEERRDTLGMLDAILYAAAEPRLDLVEIHKRIVRGSSVFRLPSSQDDLSTLVKEVEARLDKLHQGDVGLYFGLAADALKRLQTMRPFVDGNGRLGEVMSAAILKNVAPFPHRVYPVGPPLFRKHCPVATDGSASQEEIIRLMIEEAYERLEEMKKHDGGGDFDLDMDVAW